MHTDPYKQEIMQWLAEHGHTPDDVEEIRTRLEQYDAHTVLDSRMLFRFCLYGFLKNQLYFEPFLILAFLQKDLSFGMIGTLIGFRALCVNLMGIPAGAVADVLGRRRLMIISFLAYIGSFVIFGLCTPPWLLFAAMFLFALGEALREGTHKAMIFDWLGTHDWMDERTAFYGRTRSWSKLGSAVAVLIAAGLVFWTENYEAIFLFSIFPYILSILNFMMYPAYLDGPRHRSGHIRGVLRTLFLAISQTFRLAKLRRLLVESMGYQGVYQSSKDYVQPMIHTACLALPFLLALGEQQRTAVAVGAVYFFMHLLGSFASRGAGRFAEACGGEHFAGRVLWFAYLVIFLMIGLAIYTRHAWISIAGFVLLAVFQNFWRPILVGQFASCADAEQAATVLSIESQAKSLSVAIFAPLIGWSVDFMTLYNPNFGFTPIAILGVLVSAAALLTRRRYNSPAEG